MLMAPLTASRASLAAKRLAYRPLPGLIPDQGPFPPAPLCPPREERSCLGSLGDYTRQQCGRGRSDWQRLDTPAPEEITLPMGACPNQARKAKNQKNQIRTCRGREIMVLFMGALLLPLDFYAN